ncbi:MAG TPA: hypothetical protein VGM88_28745 [Kofleriaceae bacterium]
MTLAACSHATAVGPAHPSEVTVEISGQHVSVPHLFAHVPADATIVAGSFEPPPLDYLARWRDLMGSAFDEEIAKASTDDDRAFGALYKAVMAELGGKLTAAGWQATGMSMTMRVAMYGLGDGGVLRMEIGDGAKVRHAIEHIAAVAKVAMPVPTTLGAYTVWQFPQKNDRTTLIAIGDGELVFGGDLTAKLAAELPVMVGTVLPAHNMGDGALIASELNAHGFHAGLFGLVDLHGVFAASKDEKPACQALLLRFSESVPRLVLGVGEMNGQRLTVGFGVDLVPDIAARFTALETTAGPLDELLRTAPEGEPAIAASIGVSLDGLRHAIADFAEPTAQFSEACAKGEDDDDIRHKVADLLGFKIPPELAGLTGGGFAIYDFVMGDGMPKTFDAVVAASGETAGQALNWLGSIAGQPAIDPDAQLHPLAISGLLPFPVLAGSGPHAAVVAAGTMGSSAAIRILRAPVGTAKTPLAAGQMNMDRLHHIVVALGTESEKDAATWKNLAEFARFGATLEADAHGLVFWFSADWKPAR